jgi:hypothetical protein
MKLYTFTSNLDFETLQWSGWAPKKVLRGLPHGFRTPLHPIHNQSSCPGASEPITVFNPFGYLRIKGANDEEANVRHGKTKIDKMVRRGELPCFRRSGRCIKNESFVVRC